MRISWINPEDIIEYELQQSKLERKNVEQLISEWNELKKQNLTAELLLTFKEKVYNLLHQPVTANIEHDQFINHVKRQFRNYRAGDLDEEILLDKIYGGWIGRASGCLLGKPVEKYSREIIKIILSSSGQWPLEYFISGEKVPEDLKSLYPWNKHSGVESLCENIVCMPEDDDLNYTMLNLHVAEKFGKDFTTENVAESWLEFIPVLSTFTAERVAYINLLNQISPLKSALVCNPYRKWIGALIRADLWGWVSYGNPIMAAELAWKDAALSHINEGILGEVFVAGMLSMSFYENDINHLIKNSMKLIPQESKIYEALDFALDVSTGENEWEIILDKLHQKYEYLHWVHVINNTALITASLIWGKGEYAKSICAAVMGGWDTDSNAATVGSVLGVINGYKKLPLKWTEPLNNKIRSSMKGFDYSEFDLLAKRTLNVAKKIRENNDINK